ncbi:hypothetical protein L3V86_00120 [Thiotrichales bacterium 19S11-10]|nr:hypothetical protein [Thiotrichales bacterium 19S11-10]
MTEKVFITLIGHMYEEDYYVREEGYSILNLDADAKLLNDQSQRNNDFKLLTDIAIDAHGLPFDSEYFYDSQQKNKMHYSDLANILFQIIMQSENSSINIKQLVCFSADSVEVKSGILNNQLIINGNKKSLLQNLSDSLIEKCKSKSLTITGIHGRAIRSDHNLPFIGAGIDDTLFQAKFTDPKELQIITHNKIYDFLNVFAWLNMYKNQPEHIIQQLKNEYFEKWKKTEKSALCIIEILEKYLDGRYTEKTALKELKSNINSNNEFFVQMLMMGSPDFACESRILSSNNIDHTLQITYSADNSMPFYSEEQKPYETPKNDDEISCSIQ